MLEACGREFAHAESPPISTADIRRWAIAVYYPETPPPLFWDEEYAAATVHGGIVAPEEFNPFAWTAALGPEASHHGPRSAFVEQGLGIAAPACENDLFGGVEIEYTAERMRPGDVIQSRSFLRRYWEREGSLGLMLFTETEVRWTRGIALIKVQRNVMIRY